MLPRITTGSSKPVVAIDGRPGEHGGGAPLLSAYPAVNQHSAERRLTAPALHEPGAAQRQEMQHSRAAGQRLADGVEQREVGRPGEHEAAGLAPGVDFDLKIGEQLQHPLDLVQDGAVSMVAEEPSGIGSSVFANVRGLEGHVGLVAEHGAAQRRRALGLIDSPTFNQPRAGGARGESRRCPGGASERITRPGPRER
jgi:hypothetical protein